jgi:hypothetical protein
MVVQWRRGSWAKKTNELAEAERGTSGIRCRRLEPLSGRAVALHARRRKRTRKRATKALVVLAIHGKFQLIL